MPFLAFFLPLERLFFLSGILYHFRGDTQMINSPRSPMQEIHLIRTLPARIKRFFFAIALSGEVRTRKRCRKKKCCGAQRSIFPMSRKWSDEVRKSSDEKPTSVGRKTDNCRTSVRKSSKEKSRNTPPNPLAPASGWVGRAHWKAGIGTLGALEGGHWER